jgi:hypothetical protein
MKQLVPTSIDEYLEEHKEGDVVSGRVVDEAAVHAGALRVGQVRSFRIVGLEGDGIRVEMA